MKWHGVPTICVLILSTCVCLQSTASAQTRSSRTSLSRPLSESFSSDTPQDTALLFDAYAGDMDQVKHLLRNGANVNAQQQNPHFYHGWTPICFATIKSNLVLVRLLLERHADVRTCGLPVDVVRNPEIIDLLLQHGADPNEGRGEGSRNTPLLVAAMNWWADPAAYTTIIGSLLRYGADPNVRNSSGGTALLQIRSSPFARLPQNHLNRMKVADTSSYFPRVVKLLVEHGARVDDTQVSDIDGSCCASPDYRNGVPYCHVLSPQGCNLLAQYAPCGPGRLEHFDTGVTPLMQAAQSNNISLTSALLDAGADVSRRDSQNRTVVDLAPTEEMKALFRREPLRNKSNWPSKMNHQASSSSPAVASSGKLPPSTSKSGEPTNQIERDVHLNEFICYQGPNWRTVLKQTADSSFGSEEFLDVTVNDPNQMMTSGARAVLATEITNALVIWRRMCVECATANAAVLRINGIVYMDPNLKSIIDTVDYSRDYEAQRQPAAYTRGCSPSKPARFAASNPASFMESNTSGSNQPSPEESKAASGWPIDLSESFLSTRLGLRVPLFPYVMVSASDYSVTNLCAAPYVKLPAILKGVRAAFECPADAQLPHTSRAHLKIKLVDGYTSCGPDDNIVGCESNEFLLEVNANRYKFVEHGTGQPLFGHGRLMVDSQVVLMHELGHWVGIQQHLATHRNIMSAYLSDAHCIDEAVVRALASVTQTPAEPTHGRALYYQKPDSRSRMNSVHSQNGQ